WYARQWRPDASVEARTPTAADAVLTTPPSLRRRHGRHVGRIPTEESPRLLCPVARIVHADSRGAHDAWLSIVGAGRFLDPECIAEQVRSVVSPVHVHGPAQQTRAVSLVFDALDWLQRAQQHRMWHAVRGRDHVHAVPKAVD